MTRLHKLGIGLGGFVVISFILLMIFMPWAHIDNYELGYKFDSRNGQITVFRNPDSSLRAGYVARTPFFDSIHTIDLRPRQVCITVGSGTGSTGSAGANSRVLNCKLVRFEPGRNDEGLRLFLSWHGRDSYYDSSLDDLLKIYAYDGLSGSCTSFPCTPEAYPFLTILRELRNADIETAAPTPAVPAAAPLVNSQ